jgi:hypothetical protein
MTAITENVAAAHPAKWSTPVLEAITLVVEAEADRVAHGLSILDPMAGIGRARLEQATKPYARAVAGVELQPEWCTAGTVQGDATRLDFASGLFDGVVTSPVFGNRMSDHHDARDACGACRGTGLEDVLDRITCSRCKGTGLSWRNTYAHALRRHGGDLVAGSAAALQWGPAYRQLHKRILSECIRVVVEDGMLAVNMSNHLATKVKGGPQVEQLVTEWWLNEIIVAGCRIREVRRVESRRQRDGANGGIRVDGECLIVAHTPTQRRLV